MPFLAAIAPTFLIFIIAMAGFIITAVRKRSRAVEEAWQGAAQRMKLDYTPKRGMTGKRRLEGDYRGYSVRVNTFTQNNGNNSGSSYTRYTLFMPSLQLGMDLSQQHFLSRLTNTINGGQDLAVGDPDFDKAVIVKSAAPHATRGFLTPNRRLQIRKFLTDARRGRVTDDEITFIEAGVAKKAEALRLSADRLVSLADILQLPSVADSVQTRQEGFRNEAQEPRSSREDQGDRASFEEAPSMPTMAIEPPQLPQATGPKDVRDPDAALAFPWQNEPEPEGPVETPAEEPIAVDFKLLIEDPPTASVEPTPTIIGFDEQVPRPITHLETSLQDTVEDEANPPFKMSQRVAPVSLSESPEEPEVQPEEAQVDSPDSAAGVDYIALRDALFETNLMSSQTKDYFDANYAGRVVKWSGKLRRISAYTSDFTFQGTVGSKAIVELEGIADGSFTKGVQAVVQLPTEVATELGNQYDIQVEFTGKLHSCDGFLRDIFIEAGSMTAL
jgi:hypothetical protein